MSTRPPVSSLRRRVPNSLYFVPTFSGILSLISWGRVGSVLAVSFPIHNICFSSGSDVDREQRRKYLLPSLWKRAKCFSFTFVQEQRTAGEIPILSPPRRMISKTFSIAPSTVVRTRLQVFGSSLRMPRSQLTWTWRYWVKSTRRTSTKS